MTTEPQTDQTSPQAPYGAVPSYAPGPVGGQYPGAPYAGAPYPGAQSPAAQYPAAPYPAAQAYNPYGVPGQLGGGYPPQQGQFGPRYGPAPGVGPVILFTAIFGVFGAISAVNRAKKARTAGAPEGKYWIAFGATLAAMWAVIAIFAVAASAASPSEPTITSTWLESSIVANGDFKNNAGDVFKPESATCTAVTVDSDGAGTYTCMIDFSAKDRQSTLVTVDATGKWVTQPQ